MHFIVVGLFFFYFMCVWFIFLLFTLFPVHLQSFGRIYWLKVFFGRSPSNTSLLEFVVLSPFIPNIPKLLNV